MLNFLPWPLGWGGSRPWSTHSKTCRRNSWAICIQCNDSISSNVCILVGFCFSTCISILFFLFFFVIRNCKIFSSSLEPCKLNILKGTSNLLMFSETEWKLLFAKPNRWNFWYGAVNDDLKMIDIYPTECWNCKTA